MSPGSGARLGGYPEPGQLEARWRGLIAEIGGRESRVGESVGGRGLWRFDLGCRDAGAPAVLLTALIHGNEVVGSLALLDVVTRLAGSGVLSAERRRIVVMPIANPDGFAATMDRLRRGLPAWRRGNANGVDLNRNFPPPPASRNRWGWNPLAGSGWRRSPWFRGLHALSEPESRAIADVATAVRPSLALAFHSFGQILLHPWAFDRAPHPRAAEYRALGDAFLNGRAGSEFKVRQAAAWYPMIGDLDDWLDVTFGTLAFTVEVSRLDRRLLHPRATNPFWWANPIDTAAALDQVTPSVLALLEASR
ncbi:MAG TPA: M14 family metallopeptidase [Polyangia bacterium]|nr:M14 family metallopeptidase [Polyangia bacterium]